MSDNKQHDNETPDEPGTGDDFTVPQPDQFESGVPRNEAPGSEQAGMKLDPQGFNERLNQGQKTVTINSNTGQTEQTIDLSSGKFNLLGGMTIRTKLVASLSVLTIIIIMLGVIALTSIIEINDYSLSITNEHAALARVTEEVKSTVYLIRDAEKDFLLLEEQQALDRSIRRIAQLRDKLGKATALGETIAEKSGKDIGSQYLALGESVDNYEQQFARQVKDVRAARDDINKGLAGTVVLKKQLIDKVDILADQIRNLVNDFWIDGKRQSREATEAAELLASKAEQSSVEALEKTVTESKRIAKSLELGVLMGDLERAALQIQVWVARYLQLNQQLYADTALTEMNSAINTAESIRQVAKEEGLILAMKQVIRSVDGYRQLFRSAVTEFNEVESKKLRVDQQIAGQKAGLKAIGENLISRATELSSGAWGNVKQESLALRQTGADAQFVVLVMVVIGSIIGIAVLILVPRPILQGIGQLLNGAQRVAAGDLTQPINVSSKDELGQLAATFNHMRANLLSLVDRIQRASTQITTTVNEIQAAANQQASTANEQSTSISQFTATLGEVAQTAEQLSRTANVLSEGANSVSESMNESSNRAGLTLESMSAIGESTRQTSERIKALNDQMDGINDAVTTIASVADQTTLLSLNAAIEANKAGEMGKGFSVVATEIRRLSDRSIESANGIALMVRDIQRATESSVVSMDKSAEEIRQGIDLVKQSSDAMIILKDQVGNIRQQTQTISSGSAEQASGSRDVQNTIGQFLSSTEIATQAARQTSGAAFELASMATQLADAVSAFKT